MKYEIKGDTLPVVICHLEAGERMHPDHYVLFRLIIPISEEKIYLAMKSHNRIS